MVYSYTRLYYVCICDICNRTLEVCGASDEIYNRAQAVRSLGWSFGNNGKIKCSFCRRPYIRQLRKRDHK